MIWLVHLVIAVLLIETGVLTLTRRPLLRELAPHLLAGLGLLLALRSVVLGEPWPAAAFWLAASGLAHAAGVWRATRPSLFPRNPP